MILSQHDLRKAVEAGAIGFDPPLEEQQWGEASVDLRLSYSFTKLQNVTGVTISVAEGLQTLALTNLWKTMQLEEKDKFGHPTYVVLHPGEFILALTYEIIRVPTNLIALIEGRSTYARVGLSMHQTAPWIQPGWSGPIVLEMMNHGPLDIKLTPKVDRPCQLTFFELRTSLSDELAYGSRPEDRYQDQQHPLKHNNENDSVK